MKKHLKIVLWTCYVLIVTTIIGAGINLYSLDPDYYFIIMSVLIVVAFQLCFWALHIALFNPKIFNDDKR